MPVKRDQYGRYKGKGGIKPYKSNLAGNKRKRLSRKKKVAIAGAAVVGAVAVSRVGQREIAKKERAASTITIGRRGPRLSKKEAKVKKKALKKTAKRIKKQTRRAARSR